MDRITQIVLLNGVRSAGKSSIARALQAVAHDYYLHVEMDVFHRMMPAASFGRTDGLIFETIQQNGKPVVAVHQGPMAMRAMRGMRRAIAAMASQGNNMIVDEVILGPERIEYAELLAPFEVFMVGVFAPLDVLEAREALRPDRQAGLVRWQHGRVHKDMNYDLEVDTSAATPAACASLIQQRFGL